MGGTQQWGSSSIALILRVAQTFAKIGDTLSGVGASFAQWDAEIFELVNFTFVYYKLQSICLAQCHEQLENLLEKHVEIFCIDFKEF